MILYKSYPLKLYNIRLTNISAVCCVRVLRQWMVYGGVVMSMVSKWISF